MKCFQKYSRWLRIYKTNPFESQSSQLKIPHNPLTSGNIVMCAYIHIYSTSLALLLIVHIEKYFFLNVMHINEWDTAMLLTELWIENWQVCSCGTIQILKAREKDNEVTKKKGETLIKKKKWRSDWSLLNFTFTFLKNILAIGRTAFVTLIPHLFLELLFRGMCKKYIKQLSSISINCCLEK